MFSKGILPIVPLVKLERCSCDVPDDTDIVDVRLFETDGNNVPCLEGMPSLRASAGKISANRC